VRQEDEGDPLSDATRSALLVRRNRLGEGICGKHARFAELIEEQVDGDVCCRAGTHPSPLKPGLRGRPSAASAEESVGKPRLPRQR